MSSQLTGIILVGGKGERLGQDKARVEIGGQSLLQHAIDRLSPVCHRLLVVGSPGRKPPPVATKQPYATLTDVLPGLGPLGGIYTGLCASDSDLNFALACDMPMVNPEVVRHLARLAEDCKAVVPVVEGRPKPLHAVYRRDCREAMREALDAGQLAVQRFLEGIRVRYVSEEELRPLDPKLHSFLNVNTPADLESARRLMTGNL